MIHICKPPGMVSEPPNDLHWKSIKPLKLASRAIQADEDKEGGAEAPPWPWFLSPVRFLASFFFGGMKGRRGKEGKLHSAHTRNFRT